MWVCCVGSEESVGSEWKFKVGDKVVEVEVWVMGGIR